MLLVYTCIDGHASLNIQTSCMMYMLAGDLMVLKGDYFIAGTKV